MAYSYHLDVVRFLCLGTGNCPPSKWTTACAAADYLMEPHTTTLAEGERVMERFAPTFRIPVRGFGPLKMSKRQKRQERLQRHERHQHFLRTKDRRPRPPTARSKPLKIGKVDPVSTEFLQTFEWRKLRMVVLTKRGAVCECCGNRPPACIIHVDHIKPRRKYPELALEESNLQVLCEVCNHGKGAWDETDWRDVSQKSGESSANSPVTRSGDGDGTHPAAARGRLVIRDSESRSRTNLISSKLQKT